MRPLADLIGERMDENKIAEENRIAIGVDDLFAIPTSRHIDLIVRGDENHIVAVVQNGQLHESLTVFETGLEGLLHLDKLTDFDGYELDEVTLFHEDDAQVPTQAAVFLKRMPGPFYTSSTLRTTPEQVHPADPEDYSLETAQGDDFGHIMMNIERAARDEAASYEPSWSFADYPRREVSGNPAPQAFDHDYLPFMDADGETCGYITLPSVGKNPPQICGHSREEHPMSVAVGSVVPDELCGVERFGLISSGACSFLPNHDGDHSWQQ